MSRIGRKPISVPAGVEVSISGNSITVKGSGGELKWQWEPEMQVEYDGEVREISVSRPNDERRCRALHGMTRSLINNMVEGVTNPFQKKLEIQGVGYNATLAGDKINLQVGFANTIALPVPSGVTCELPDPTHIVIKGPDKQVVGQFAADIRSVRPPEPYKGKGIRYQDEHVRRKAGKAFASG